MAVSQQLTSSIIGAHIDAKFQQNLKATAQAVLGIITGGFGWVAKKVAFNDKTALGRAFNRVGTMRAAMNRIAGRPQRK